MKKGLLLLGLIVLLLPGCISSGPMPVFIEGVYPLKAKVLSYFEFSSKALDLRANIAELTETKPDNLTVDFDYGKLNEVRFGSFKFGNNEQKTWFLMVKDTNGYWSDFYIDQNLDQHITKQDKIDVQTADGRYNGFKTSAAITAVPIPIQVSYKGETKDFTKKLYFFIEIDDFSKKDLHDTLVKAFTATFFEGTVPILSGQTSRLYNFKLIDANSSGCFNDYGKDLVYLDENNEGYFQKNESHTLIEYFDSPAPDNQQKQVIVLPYPAKIAITKVNQNIDLTTLEPEPDQPVQTELKQKTEAGSLSK
jgi:hypothetical protein